MARITVTELASALGCLPEAIRSANNLMHIKMNVDEAFEYPQGTQLSHWMRVLITQPANAAERMLRDIGVRPARRMPKG